MCVYCKEVYMCKISSMGFKNSIEILPARPQISGYGSSNRDVIGQVIYPFGFIYSIGKLETL